MGGIELPALGTCGGAGGLAPTEVLGSVSPRRTPSKPPTALIDWTLLVVGCALVAWVVLGIVRAFQNL
jgi:hypothetical protein